jgi:hypothetical protein
MSPFDRRFWALATPVIKQNADKRRTDLFII